MGHETNRADSKASIDHHNDSKPDANDFPDGSLTEMYVDYSCPRYKYIANSMHACMHAVYYYT